MVYIDTSDGDGENEKQDRRLQRQAVAMAMAMARDIQPHSTWNPLIKPIQPDKQRETKEERAIGGGGDRRKLEEERLMRGRKTMLCTWERKGAESQVQRERKKIVKKLYARATVPVHICTGIIATCIFTQVYTHWCRCFFFCSYCVKWVPFSILHNFTSTDVIALIMYLLVCEWWKEMVLWGWRSMQRKHTEVSRGGRIFFLVTRKSMWVWIEFCCIVRTS